MSRVLGDLLSALRRLAGSWVLFAALGLIVGLQIAPYAASFAAAQTGSEGTVAVVPLEGGIDGVTASALRRTLAEARQDPSIQAVVLLVNSPGGGAGASETIYLQVSQTAAQMPVIGSVDAIAASGAYYALAGADKIYAKPSSLVGSVGVFTLLPAQIEPIAGVITSGPDKLRSGDARDWYYKTEAVQNAFVNAVMQGRGDRLQISRGKLAHAELYAGSVAAQKGLVDEIGGLSAAIKEAARRAGMDSYTVRVMRPRSNPIFVTRTAYVASGAPQKRLVEPATFTGRAGERTAVANILMLPGSVIAAAAGEPPANRTAGNRTGGVVSG